MREGGRPDNERERDPTSVRFHRKPGGRGVGEREREREREKIPAERGERGVGYAIGVISLLFSFVRPPATVRANDESGKSGKSDAMM